jgi:hypothetical protein
MDRVFTAIERAALPKQVVYSDFARDRCGRLARTYNVHPTSIGRLQASTPPFRREEGPAAAAQV